MTEHRTSNELDAQAIERNTAVIERGATAATDYFRSIHDQLASLSPEDLQRWLTGFAISHMEHCAAAVGSRMAVMIVEGALDLHIETHEESST